MFGFFRSCAVAGRNKFGTAAFGGFEEQFRDGETDKRGTSEEDTVADEGRLEYAGGKGFDETQEFLSRGKITESHVSTALLIILSVAYENVCLSRRFLFAY